jgi:arginase
MYLEPLSFLGISTQQGQQKLGLVDSPQTALKLFPKEWQLTKSSILRRNANTAKIHRWDDLNRLDWDIYSQAYREIRHQLSHGHFHINWGGDHSIGVATVGAFTSLYTNGFVLWIDAHADLNTPASSPTGNFHGMPMSFLLGIGAKSSPLASPLWKSLHPSRLIYLGLRDLDPYEKYLINELGITAYYAEDLSDERFPRIIEEIKAKVGHRPLHISFDIDSMDPIEAPSTGVPCPLGLSSYQIIQLSDELKAHCQVKSVDIVEINPEIGTVDDVLKTYMIAFNFLAPLIRTKKENTYVRNHHSTKNHLPVSLQWHLPIFPQSAL